MCFMVDHCTQYSKLTFLENLFNKYMSPISPVFITVESVICGLPSFIQDTNWDTEEEDYILICEAFSENEKCFVKCYHRQALKTLNDINKCLATFLQLGSSLRTFIHHI